MLDCVHGLNQKPCDVLFQPNQPACLLEEINYSRLMPEIFDSEKWLATRPGRAPDLVRRVEKCWMTISQSKTQDQDVALLIATPFGIRRVSSMFAIGADTIIITPTDGGVMFVPTEQCAFQFEIFQPTTEKPRIIVGFAPQKGEE